MSPTAPVPVEAVFPVKIIKVCFLSNSSNMGKNFKLIRCEEEWTVKVHSTVFFYTLLSFISCFSAAVLYGVLLEPHSLIIIKDNPDSDIL